jgi:hypothetical protein
MEIGAADMGMGTGVDIILVVVPIIPPPKSAIVGHLVITSTINIGIQDIGIINEYGPPVTGPTRNIGYRDVGKPDITQAGITTLVATMTMATMVPRIIGVVDYLERHLMEELLTDILILREFGTQVSDKNSLIVRC